MKVGFDGILLGAWMDVSDDKYILDIGSGSGLLALMAAQKNSEAIIYAIEPHLPSYLEAIQNIKHSPWSDRIKGINKKIQSYYSNSNLKFDHLICNPPYFDEFSVPDNESQKISKHKFMLSSEELIDNSARLLKPSGKLSLILPFADKKNFIELASERQFTLLKLVNVISKKSVVKRILMEFVFKSTLKITTEESGIEIYKQDGSYSSKYIDLVKDFYLKY